MRARWTSSNGTAPGSAEVGVATTAIAAGGKVYPGQRHQARLTLRPETYARAKVDGIRVLSELQLPPGRYQLRVAGGQTTGRAGSVIYDLEVADFSKDPLMMSGVSLTSAAAEEAPDHSRPSEPFAGALPGPIRHDATLVRATPSPCTPRSTRTSETRPRTRSR